MKRLGSEAGFTLIFVVRKKLHVRLMYTNMSPHRFVSHITGTLTMGIAVGEYPMLRACEPRLRKFPRPLSAKTKTARARDVKWLLSWQKHSFNRNQIENIVHG